MKRKPKVTKKELLMAMAEIKNSDKVKKAMEIAQNAHKSQVRDGGGSYLTEHIYYLTSLIYADYKNDPRVEDLVIISLLHDSVEDGEVSLLYLKELFGERISDIIGLLSKPNDDDDDAKTQEEKYLTNQNYLHNMSSNEEAIIVKLYDRLANINCIMEDNVVLKPDKYKRYVLEVRNLFIPLAKKYKFSKILTEYEKEVDRIEKLFNGM
jgi:(p)ppGpp synthase/HD superfamily hydrolase